MSQLFIEHFIYVVEVGGGWSWGCIKSQIHLNDCIKRAMSSFYRWGNWDELSQWLPSLQSWQVKRQCLCDPGLSDAGCFTQDVFSLPPTFLPLKFSNSSLLGQLPFTLPSLTACDTFCLPFAPTPGKCHGGSFHPLATDTQIFNLIFFKIEANHDFNLTTI